MNLSDQENPIPSNQTNKVKEMREWAKQSDDDVEYPEYDDNTSCY